MNDFEVIALVQRAYAEHVATCAYCDHMHQDGQRCYAAEGLEQAIRLLEQNTIYRQMQPLLVPYLNLFSSDSASGVLDGFGEEDGSEGCDGDCDNCPGCGV